MQDEEKPEEANLEENFLPKDSDIEALMPSWGDVVFDLTQQAVSLVIVGAIAYGGYRCYKAVDGFAKPSEVKVTIPNEMNEEKLDTFMAEFAKAASEKTPGSEIQYDPQTNTVSLESVITTESPSP